MSGIFLSYRRDDAAGWAGRLYEHLVQEWGSDQVFMDIDTIAPGEDYRDAINRTLAACDVVMVVIGPKWASAQDQTGNRRLDDERDTHRAEVVAALTSEVRVVPVLVGGATMPQASELPEALKQLTYRNAAVIDDRRFAADVAGLQATIRRLTGSDRRQRTILATPRRVRGGSSFSTWQVLVAVAGAGLAVVWGLLLDRWHDEYGWVRLLAVGLLVVGVAAGLWARQRSWILWAGVAGLGVLLLWLLQLLSTHPTETAEIVSPAQDGFENAVVLLGALMILLAGAGGMRRRRSGN